MRRLMILNLHRHLRVNATTVSTQPPPAHAWPDNNSLQFGEQQLHSELPTTTPFGALHSCVRPSQARPGSGHMRPTRRAPLNANYFISVPIVVLLFFGLCSCASSKANHRQQQQQNRQQREETWRGAREGGIVEIVVLSLLLLIFHVPNGDEDGVRHNCGSD